MRVKLDKLAGEKECKECIGVSKEYADEWNRLMRKPEETGFVYVETDIYFGWVMK